MENSVDPWKEAKSLADVKYILNNLPILDLNQMSKKVLITILSGFGVIVKIYEENRPESNDEANEDIILKWIRLYLDLQSLSASSDVHLKLFQKSVPIAVTYIIGCLLHVSNVSPKFYTEFMRMATQLISQTDKRALKKLEAHSNRSLIAYFWKFIAKVGSFNSQMMALQFILLILRNFDDNLALIEVEKIPNISTIAKEWLFQLLRVDYNDIYQRLSRKLLVETNKLLGSCSLVHSFPCESFNIANQLNFSKAKHNDRFWIDVNSKPFSITFHANFLLKDDTYVENVDVSLEIKKFCCDKAKLKIEFIPPANISGTTIHIKKLKTMSEAYAVLPDYEMKRFLKIFKVHVPKLQPNADKVIHGDNSTLNSDVIDLTHPNRNCETVTFKKPSLEIFEAAVGISKPKPFASQMASDELKDLRTNSLEQETIATLSSTAVAETETTSSTRRFFRNPRQPKKYEIPWKTQPIRKPISTLNHMKKVQQVQPITTHSSQKKRSCNDVNQGVQEKRCRLANEDTFDIFYDGPTTSENARKIQSQMIGKESQATYVISQNSNIRGKTALTECREMEIHPPTIKEDSDKLSKEPLKSKVNVIVFQKPFEKKTSDTNSAVSTNTNNDLKKHNENSTDSENKKYRIKRSSLKRNIKYAYSDSSFASSSDDSDWEQPQQKRVRKKRRHTKSLTDSKTESRKEGEQPCVSNRGNLKNGSHLNNECSHVKKVG